MLVNLVKNLSYIIQEKWLIAYFVLTRFHAFSVRPLDYFTKMFYRIWTNDDDMNDSTLVNENKIDETQLFELNQRKEY